MHYFIDVLKKYTEFDGRATRKEYWMYALLAMIIGQGISIVVGKLFGLTALASIWSTIFFLGTFCPNLAVIVRRLHDTNRSGWWVFINFIPILGNITFIIFLVLDSQSGSNQYGPNPKEVVVSN